MKSNTIDVNEVGTIASSVTIPILPTGAPSKKKVKFIADRPFLFLIRDQVSNQIVYIGTLAEPKEIIITEWDIFRTRTKQRIISYFGNKMLWFENLFRKY